MDKLKKPNTAVKCDICGHEFTLTKKSLEERKLTLQKEGLKPHEVQVTFLTCPRCVKCSASVGNK